MAGYSDSDSVFLYSQGHSDQIGDSVLVRSLVMHGINYPTIFSLVWGEEMAAVPFPPKIRQIVTDILQEEEKKKDCYDNVEKELRDVIIDLLWFMFGQEVMVVINSIQELEKSVMECLLTGDKIRAIQRYEDVTGANSEVALDAVNEIERRMLRER